MNKTLASISLLSAITVSAVIGYGTASMFSHEPGKSGHSQHDITTGQPKEAGQAAFAAIAEIVAMLTDDPDTDWSKVDINRLREHLVDMNALTINAEVESIQASTAVEFTISGTGVTLRAIQAMVPAHAKELAKTPGWHVAAAKTDTGATLVVGSDYPTELTKINALGFFGLMATGAHHQPHHLGMASGLHLTH